MLRPPGRGGIPGKCPLHVAKALVTVARPLVRFVLWRSTMIRIALGFPTLRPDAMIPVDREDLSAGQRVIITDGVLEGQGVVYREIDGVLTIRVDWPTVRRVSLQ